MGSFPAAWAQALIFLEIEPIMTANLTHPAIEIYWTSGELSAYQILPCAASQKQLPLLKESSAYLTINPSENLLCIGSNSWEEETRKTANLDHQLYIYCLLGDPDILLNDNQLLEMAQDRHRWRKNLCSTAPQPKDDDDELQSKNFKGWQATRSLLALNLKNPSTYCSNKNISLKNGTL